MTTLLTEIITLLTGGFSTFATGLGSGIGDYISALFVTESNNLTTFGGIVIIFAAIALTMSLSRWVLNFITSLGARNR